MNSLRAESDSRDNAQWSRNLCNLDEILLRRVTGKGNVIRCWWIFSYMWSAWRNGQSLDPADHIIVRIFILQPWSEDQWFCDSQEQRRSNNRNYSDWSIWELGSARIQGVSSSSTAVFSVFWIDRFSNSADILGPTVNWPSFIFKESELGQVFSLEIKV